jgi:2-polyprenyl-3-methyl-5-hydroxy-6-metoxy-1,4-benzoquinol methylase
MTTTATAFENSTVQRLARARVEDFEDTRAEAFAEKMIGTLNAGALALMISIGHRTRLFDVMSKINPATSEEIARAARLNERYVREWLGAMVTGQIVEYYPAYQTYYLPQEHAASLTRAASPVNLASTMQFLPLLGAVEDQIVECFQKGGGVPYSAYPRFQEVMAEESAMTVGSALLEAILPLVPGLVEQLEEGIEVLDVGCGRGHALNILAQTFPKSNFTGYDFSAEGLAGARAEANELGLTNVRFVVKDVAEIQETDRYQLITAFDAIHDQAHPRQVLKAIAQALRPDGIFLMQDIRASSHVHQNLGHPIGPFTYTVSCLHCMTVSLALGGEGLGAAWGEEKALELLAEAGFDDVTVHQLPHDMINNYYIAKRRRQ